MTYSILMLLLATALVVIGLPLLTIVLIILLIARRLRQTYVIQAKPLLTATPAEAVPPELASLLAEVTPALEQLGFTIAANVHAPDFGPMLTWTQVLYLNRDRGERASVMCLRKLPGPRYGAAPARPNVAFATEWDDGQAIKTAALQLSAQGLLEAYERHRGEVEKKGGVNRDKPGIVPDAGSETAWLQARAGRVARAVAEKLSCAFDPEGDCYRVSWGRAIEAARKRIRDPRGTAGRGFSVIAQQPPASPDTDPLTDL